MNAREAAGRFGGLTIYGLAVEYAKSKVGSRHRTDVVAELENRSAEIARLRKVQRALEQWVDARERHPQVAGELYRELMNVAGLNKQ